MWKNDIINSVEDKASCPPQPLMPHLLHEHDFFEALKTFYNNTNMLSSGLSKHLRVMPSSFFGVSLFLVEGSRDFWHWFSGPFPYSISPSSSPYLHKPGFRRTTEIPKIHFKETVLPISKILPAHIHSEVAWPQLILTEVAIAGDIWSKYPSPGLAASDAVVIHVIFYAQSSIWSTWSSIWSLIGDQPAPRSLKLLKRCRTRQVEWIHTVTLMSASWS